MALTLLLGGARSGKSSLAVDIGRRHAGPVTFVATAPSSALDPVGTDDDMQHRIARHRAERPAEWTTIEETVDLRGALSGCADSLVIIDCLTLWTSNMMWDGVDDVAIADQAEEVAALAAHRSAPVVVISNEVGMGVHPETDLGRRYRDLLGRVNQTWAAAAETTLLLVAGRAMRLDDPWPHLQNL